MNRKLAVRLLACSFAALLLMPSYAAAASPAVRVWEEDTVIPTYLVGPPDPNPTFFFGADSQGAARRVYPYPMYDNLTGKKVDKSYKMVYLENEYVRIGILPEIGGRIFEAVDKTNNYNFFYRQHVIKPALISLLGAWISGGVEWNIPHHHRATSFLPVQYRTEENADGGKTVWVGELELRDRMRWAVGCTLRPGKSYLEVSVRILNRTPVVNTMLCFANVAVHVNENYQVIFPPSTQHVTYHKKNQFTTWPIATTMYNGADFTRGVDVSWYKNHYSSNSMFAWNYVDDFFAGYDHGKQAGTMSVADHHVVPGKKLWTWGNGPSGRAQDRILTDADGPYIELMVGAYSDNQPDYSWLQPYEVKSFEQYWYPFRDIGGVKNANLEAAVNLDVLKGPAAKVGFYTTSAHPAATVALRLKDKVLFEEQVAIDPGKPYVKQVPIPAGADEHDLRASLSVGGKELVAYSPIRLTPEPMPSPIQTPAPPEGIKTNEELYLTGLRIGQFHESRLKPDPYWEEALRRDPSDVRVNTALGIACYKRAEYEKAERLLRTALTRLTMNYTTPKDGEPFYYLALALRAQGKTDEAFEAFYKATWSAAWRAPAYYALAEIASSRGEAAAAVDLVDRSLEANVLNIRALTLKAALLRGLGRASEALALAPAFHKVDPLDVRAMTEVWLASKTPAAQRALLATLRDHPATGLETAAEYLNAGLWQDGTALLLQLVEATPDKSKVSPLAYYYLGHFAEKMGLAAKAAEYYALAERMSPDYVFPFQREVIDVLGAAMKANPDDSRAPYYLGNLLFDWQPEAAVQWWQKSIARGASFAMVYHNMAGVYTRQGSARDQALAYLEKAVSLEPNALHLFEIDQLYEQAGTPPEKRLALFEKAQPVVLQRNDALFREICLKIFMGKCDDAIELLKARNFDVQEGGTRLNVAGCWVDAHLLRGHQHFAAKRFREALADYQAALVLPKNLEEPGAGNSRRRAEIAYWIGVADEALGDLEKARQSWKESVAAAIAPVGAGRGALGGRGTGRGGGRGGRGGVGGGRGAGGGGGGGLATTGSPEALRYYQALALRKLGETEKAKAVFQDLVQAGSQAAQGVPQSPRARTANAHYVAALGYLGLGDKTRAEQELTQALQASPDHLGAKIALAEPFAM